MLPWINWNVMEVMLHDNPDCVPTVTAELELSLDPRHMPTRYNYGELMDDLRERLGTQPKNYATFAEAYGLLGATALSSVIDKYSRPKVTKVIFNDPATIIMWEDGSKTVVKCQNGEPFDPEKGFVMAYLKKLLGNDNTFNKKISKWVKVDSVPNIQDNRPLTNEELLNMDGKRVWCSSICSGVENFTDEFCGWHTIKNNRLYDNKNRSYNIDANGASCGFKAYLIPPKK